MNDEDDCVLPPDHPLPADQLGRYSPFRDYYAEQDIADYVTSQASDEEVLNVERIKVEYVLSDPYEIWDVTTDVNRWWVITNPTNLYSQKHFPSLDYTLSFHIGLMMRVASRSRREMEEREPTPLDEVFRRQAQAAELLDRAVEAVDFQAVGMQLRESLISLVGAVRARTSEQIEIEKPQDANVVAWSDILLHQLCPGKRNEFLRNYLKQLVAKLWPLVSWLTHHRNANKTAAIIALEGVDALVGHFGYLLSSERRDRTRSCPRCSSRNLRTHFDIGIGQSGAYFETCGECHWDGHPGYADQLPQSGA